MLKKNRFYLNINDENDLYKVSDLIINILKDKDKIDEISKFNNKVRGLQLLFGTLVDNQFKEYIFCDIGMKNPLEFYEEAITESYLTYLFALGKSSKGKEKIIEIINSIKEDRYLLDMYENEYLYLVEYPVYVLTKLYPEYRYYLGLVINDIYWPGRDHWYLELCNEIFETITNDENNRKLYSYLFLQPCLFELFYELEIYTEKCQNIVKSILDRGDYFDSFISIIKNLITINANKKGIEFYSYKNEIFDEIKEHFTELHEDYLYMGDDGIPYTFKLLRKVIEYKF